MGKEVVSRYPDVAIPYGPNWSSPFGNWHGSVLKEVCIAQFAAGAMNRSLGLRGIPINYLQYLITGSTVPWLHKFWNSPYLSSLFEHPVPGRHMEQACATGLQTIFSAADEIQSGCFEVIGVLNLDKASNSPFTGYPDQRTHRRTEGISHVWDSFGYAPPHGHSMLECAMYAAKKHGIDPVKLAEIAFERYQQYFATKESGLYDRILISQRLLNLQGKTLGEIKEDTGIKPMTLTELKNMRPAQTHPADGAASVWVVHKDRVEEISTRPEILIQPIAKAVVRAEHKLMCQAPALAMQLLLKKTGLEMDDFKAVKTHNPFIINDAIFCKELNYDYKKMNRSGCSLVYGHPHAATLTRGVLEAIEETVDQGGGYFAVGGCAAGDTGIIAAFKVDDASSKGGN